MKTLQRLAVKNVLWLGGALIEYCTASTGASNQDVLFLREKLLRTCTRITRKLNHTIYRHSWPATRGGSHSTCSLSWLVPARDGIKASFCWGRSTKDSRWTPLPPYLSSAHR
ncbi:hypothetical protein F5J12DRAFT_847319 [Pisolithus orientalis]|uniref:uncharacterized protein n=1 Tax=Pisolithus orientalis TaxID=936130 RepID=UPI002224F56E|nr:uncharacterized protein F5J12DRAFT_847319 [Pisolithus orientalis]KAI5999882.1 hypothetical protein F5J12DRAFT_847319 [Pisolithus orientalis]